ncbi:ankyrin repeat domain-containing protein [cf. Phormidesmis sp. LEGE 11477]|uniref:ankyrin repeat domain-containing protein n=1 Tax=cf. Phormidesmis sp. LEGE 11477 TaxID=1828680 RepID=UPI00187EC4F4|nr:ankyrin repeat domain-containing protein [cf. Phormidesmis sp. LEGE 11477]MBE9063876.1 ankyrin repeat domain-containing protein [cf. Phormidesmis sp. LEGE 11477]
MSKRRNRRLAIAINAHDYDAVKHILSVEFPLSYAVTEALGYGDSFDCRILSLLIQAGLDVNAVIEGHETFLMQAASRGELDAVKLLIEAGADPNIRDDDGGFALDYAGTSRNKELFIYLASRTSAELRAISANWLSSWYGRVLDSIANSGTSSEM